jgi:hypothetical protein
MRDTKVRWFLIGWCAAMLFAIVLATWANAADLPLPLRSSATSPIPRAPRSRAVTPIPMPRPLSAPTQEAVPELCVGPDVRPSAGQVMTEDKTCPGGLRWRRQ